MIRISFVFFFFFFNDQYVQIIFIIMITRVCVLVVLFAVFANYANSQKNVVCYYGTWATYRWGLGKFDVDHIKPELCTHLVYTFVGINTEGTVISLDPWLDLPDNWGRNNFGAFNALKQKNPNLKTILAVGGWNEGSAKYSVMAASPTLRKNFIDSALKMVQDHGFDGLDVDWEYPNRRDTVHGSADIDNYTTLLKELHEVFDEHGLLLSAAVASVREMASLSYDIPAISKYLDLINVMTYDMYGAWDAVTGHNSPLHKGQGDEGAVREDLYTFDVALEYWLSQGCPPEKLVLGVPFYGRTFTLVDANVNSVRAPSSGAGIAGTFTATQGVIGYNEFCVLLQTQTWTQKYDELAKVPFAYSGRNWVSYDDTDSIAKKINYGLKYNISGIMVWSIETDDFHGLCGSEDFPLLRAVNKALEGNGDVSEPSTNAPTTAAPSTVAPTTAASSTDAPTTAASSTNTPTTAEHSTDIPSTGASSTNAPTTTSPSTTTDACTTIKYSTTPSTTTGADVICVQEGYAPNPASCSSFYLCTRSTSGELVATEFDCPLTLHWDKKHLVCNYPEFAMCSVTY